MSCIMNDGGQDPYILINGFGEGYVGGDGLHVSLQHGQRFPAFQGGGNVADVPAEADAVAAALALGHMDDGFDIFTMGTNSNGDPMLQDAPLGDKSPVEVREAESVNGPLAILDSYYGVYVTCPDDAQSAATLEAGGVGGGGGSEADGVGLQHGQGFPALQGGDVAHIPSRTPTS